jgi:ADP-ribosylglycohydrolase
LAIGVYCALKARDFRSGILLAVNHGGDSDSTGSIAGNLLGLIHGEAGIPATWLERLEAREVVAQVATDLWLHFGEGDKPEWADFTGQGQPPDWERYPGN